MAGLVPANHVAAHRRVSDLRKLRCKTSRRRAARGRGCPGQARARRRSRPLRAPRERRPDARRRAHAHRPLPHPARRRFRRAGGAHDHAARPQRRRQDDLPAHHHGPVARLARRDPSRRAAPRRRARRATSRAPASPMCRRRWRSSPISACARICVLAARAGAMDEARLDWIFGFFPGAARSSGFRARARCRAGRSRCSRSPAR